MTKQRFRTRASDKVPSHIRIVDTTSIRLEAAEALEGERPPLRRFSMTAYTGGAVQLAGCRTGTDCGTAVRGRTGFNGPASA